MRSLVFDLDDTLLDEHKRIGLHTRKILDEWMDDGRHVFLATSRPLRAVREFLAPAFLERCHLVTLNGAVWRRAGGELRACSGLGDAARRLVEHRALGDVHLSIEWRGLEFSSNVVQEARALWLYQSATPDMVVPLEQVDFAQVVKVAIDGLGRSLEFLVPWIDMVGLRAIPALGGTFLNVVHPAVDKAGALQRLLEELGLDPLEMAVFGDDVPDLGMLELSGCAVAMGNACAQVKAVAHEVIGNCNEDAIGRFVLARGWLAQV